MEDNLKELMVEKAKDCFDEARKAKDPVEVEKWNQAGVKLLEQAGEMERNEEQINFEKEKYKDSKNCLDPKFLISTGTPVILLLLDKFIDRDTMWKTLKSVFEFERENTFTSLPGRGLSGAFRFPSLFNKSRYH